MTSETKTTDDMSLDAGRRDFLKRGALTGVATTGTLAAPARGLDECIELPPENAETFNTTCQY